MVDWSIYGRRSDRAAHAPHLLFDYYAHTLNPAGNKTIRIAHILTSYVKHFSSLMMKQSPISLLIS